MTPKPARFRSLLLLAAGIVAGPLAASPALADRPGPIPEEARSEHEGKPITIDGAESMVLKRGETGWRIVHIHGSSRVRPQETEP